MSQGEITEEQIESVLCNPIYIGLGPYPRLIEPDYWARNFKRFIENEGADKAVDLLVSNLLNRLSHDLFDIPEQERKTP